MAQKTYTAVPGYLPPEYPPTPTHLHPHLTHPLLFGPRRRMGGGGHDDHHPHLMFDTTTPYQPMGEFFFRGTAYSGVPCDAPLRHCFPHIQVLQLGVGLSRALYPPNLLHALGPRGAELSEAFILSTRTSPTPFFTARAFSTLFPPPHSRHAPGYPGLCYWGWPGGPCLCLLSPHGNVQGQIKC